MTGLTPKQQKANFEAFKAAAEKGGGSNRTKLKRLEKLLADAHRKLRTEFFGSEGAGKISRQHGKLSARRTFIRNRYALGLGAAALIGLSFWEAKSRERRQASGPKRAVGRPRSRRHIGRPRAKRRVGRPSIHNRR